MQEMKYFNEGNDCDICKNQLMTGRDGTVEDCRRRQNGLSCRFEECDIRTCPVCEHEVDREDMYFTTDKGIIEAEQTDTSKLLTKRPNPFMTPTVFWNTVEINRNHYGTSEQKQDDERRASHVFPA